jgi:hypothetical protein
MFKDIVIYLLSFHSQNVGSFYSVSPVEILKASDALDNVLKTDLELKFHT